MNRGYLLVLSAIVASGGAWAMGCGSSNSTTPGGDGGNDATNEIPDAELDSPLADATQSQPVDGGQDSSSDSTIDAPQDALFDSSPDAAFDAAPDAALDAAPDAALDATSDALLDSPADAPPDAPDAGPSLTAYTFPDQLAKTLCGRQASCCFPANPSSFDTTQCLPDRAAFGYFYSSLGAENTKVLGPGLLDAGNVTFNAASAQACLNDIAAIDCNTNVITTAESVAIYRDCYGAYQGTLPAGSACGGPIECAPGEFCGVLDAGSVDGGVATACQTLEGTGGACGQFAIAYHDPNSVGPILGETACSYRGSGDTGRFCYFQDLNTGNPIDGGPPAWVCTPSNGAGTGCNNDLECQTKLCDPGANNAFYQCVTSETFMYPNYCAGFLIKDAGSGG